MSMGDPRGDVGGRGGTYGSHSRHGAPRRDTHRDTHRDTSLGVDGSNGSNMEHYEFYMTSERVVLG